MRKKAPGLRFSVLFLLSSKTFELRRPCDHTLSVLFGAPLLLFTRGNQDKRVPGVRITTLPSRRKTNYCVRWLLMVSAVLVRLPIIALKYLKKRFPQRSRGRNSNISRVNSWSSTRMSLAPYWLTSNPSPESLWDWSWSRKFDSKSRRSRFFIDLPKKKILRFIEEWLGASTSNSPFPLVTDQGDSRELMKLNLCAFKNKASCG